MSIKNKYSKSIIITVFTIIISTLSYAANAQVGSIKIPITQAAKTAANTAPGSSGYSSPKIVGGNNAGRNEFPEFTQLFVNGSEIGLDPNYLYSWCGATLITSRKVLTAAHCTIGIHSTMYALPGFYSVNDPITFSDLIAVSSKAEHSLYQSRAQYDYDIAILTLNKNVTSPTAKIFAAEDTLTNYQATIIGTGLLKENGQEANVLQKVTVPIVSNTVCKASYGNSSITDQMLCAGLPAGGKDSCQGDSGGPLWIDIFGKNVQAGIVSWGNGCARPNFYGVYARTGVMVNFIKFHAPQTEFISSPVNLMPIIQLLLLDSDNPDSIDPRLACEAEELNIGDEVTVLTLNECFNDNFAPRNYFKEYKINLQKRERLTLRTKTVAAYSNSLYLYARRGNDLEHLETESSSTYGVSGVKAEIVRDFTPGEYSLFVRTFKPHGGVRLETIKNNCDATAIQLDAPFEFTFVEDCQDTFFTHNFVKYHSFTLANTMDIYITASANANKSITLYKSVNGRLTQKLRSAFSPIGNDAEISYSDLASGNYVIKTSSVPKNTSVTLEVNTINCIPTEPISFGDRIIVDFNESCQTLMNEYESHYTFELTENTDIMVRSNRAFKIDSLTSRVHDGKHIQIWGFGPGTHTISTQSSHVNANQFIRLDKIECVPQRISRGDTVVIEFSDLCRDALIRSKQIYEFTLTQARTILITAQSSDSGPGLSLSSGLGENTNYITSGDVQANGDTVIEEVLNAGNYTIISSAQDPTVPYTLSIQ